MEPPDVYEDYMYDEPETAKTADEFYDEEAAYEEWLVDVTKKAKQAKFAKTGTFDVEDYMKRHGYRQMYGRKQLLKDTAAKPDNYEMMWPLVHAICESLQFEPQKWTFGEHRFKNLETEVEFWCHRMETPVTETFGMQSYGTDKIFNLAQGEAILEAVTIAKRSKPTDLQLKVLDKFSMLNAPEVVDERHIIHVPQMTFWQRLLFLLTARCKIT